jgi:hypothetical protein
MTYYYSPHTWEYIQTDTPADWMGQTDIAPPDFEAATQGSFWRGDHWEIVNAEAEKPPVYFCTPWQIRKALNAQGLRTGVEAVIAASTDQALKDGWEFASAFRSDDPFVISMGATLGKSEAQTAELIQYASTL